MLGKWLIVGFCVVAAACAPREPESERARGEAELLASLQAYTEADRVTFVLQVTNTTEGPLDLTFPTGQSFDFVVSDGGREIWRWSAEQMFTQAIRHEQLGPGETQRHEATWEPPPGVEGELLVRGVLTASDHAVEQSARFRI
jgi:hypothetical protein